MGRLIDADLLKESVAKWLKSYKPDETETIKLACVLESVVEEIDEQPTAFDADKVVESLTNKFRIVSNDEDLEWNRAIDCAVKIVKEGGVE
jgi:hypothetical protein